MSERTEMDHEPEDDAERYLVEGTPPGDPEIERLEGLLGRYRYRPRPAGANPEPGSTAAGPRPFLVSPRLLRGLVAAAAVFVLVALAVHRFAPRGGYAVRGVPGAEWLARGAWLDTGDHLGVVEVGEIGQLEVQPGARVRLDHARDRESLFYLARGRVDASILAPPEAFQIGTQAGLSVDLGCEYSLEVDDAGVTHIDVYSGQVAFEAADRTVYVPAGYMTRILPGAGPLVPVPYLDHGGARGLARRVEDAADPTPADLDQVRLLEDRVVLFHLVRGRSQELRKVAVERLLGLGEALPADLSPSDVIGPDEALWRRWHEETLSWRPSWGD